MHHCLITETTQQPDNGSLAAEEAMKAKRDEEARQAKEAHDAKKARENAERHAAKGIQEIEIKFIHKLKF